MALKSHTHTQTHQVIQRHPHPGHPCADDAQRVRGGRGGLVVQRREGRPHQPVAVPARQGDEEGGRAAGGRCPPSLGGVVLAVVVGPAIGRAGG